MVVYFALVDYFVDLYFGCFVDCAFVCDLISACGYCYLFAFVFFCFGLLYALFACCDCGGFDFLFCCL